MVVARWGRGPGAVGLEGVDDVVEKLSAGPCREALGGTTAQRAVVPPGLSWLWEVLVAVQWSTIRGNLSTGTCLEHGMCLALGKRKIVVKEMGPWMGVSRDPRRRPRGGGSLWRAVPPA